MAPTKQLARQYKFELNRGTPSVPDWVFITGVTTWTPNPTKSDADTTDFDSEGEEEHLPASRGQSYTFGGQIKYDGQTGARDPGQLAVLAWAQKIGPEGLQQFRITEPGLGGTTYTFLGSARLTNGGGGNNDASGWTVEVRVSGKVTTPLLDDLPNAPTAVAGTNGDEHTVVTFTDPTEGDPFLAFEVVVFDELDDVVATVQSNTQPIYVGGLTNADDYTAKVRAKNAVGWGPFSAASATITPAA